MKQDRLEEQEQVAAKLRLHKQSIELIQRQKSKVHAEIDSIKAQIDAETQLHALIRTRLTQYDRLHMSGLAQTAAEFELRRHLAQHDANIKRLNSELAHREVQIGDLDIQIQQAENALQLRLMNEDHETRLRLSEVNNSLPSARDILNLRRQQAGLIASLAANGEGTWNNILLRRGEAGIARPVPIYAVEMLEPGDILEVGRLTPPDAGTMMTMCANALLDQMSPLTFVAVQICPKGN